MALHFAPHWITQVKGQTSRTKRRTRKQACTHKGFPHDYVFPRGGVESWHRGLDNNEFSFFSASLIFQKGEGGEATHLVVFLLRGGGGGIEGQRGGGYPLGGGGLAGGGGVIPSSGANLMPILVVVGGLCRAPCHEGGWVGLGGFWSGNAPLWKISHFAPPTINFVLKCKWKMQIRVMASVVLCLPALPLTMLHPTGECFRFSIYAVTEP